MIDISPCYTEAIRNIAKWRNRYSAQEYPHKIVLNMMYRVYAMDYVWKQYENGTLPHFSNTNEGLSWMERYYGQVAQEKINPRLMYWLEKSPNKNVGRVIYAKYEEFATFAEKDKSNLKLLENLYISNLLEDKCVLFYIAFRQMGKSFEDTVSLMTNYLVEDIPNINYEMAKEVFSQLLVSSYMDEHYTQLP